MPRTSPTLTTLLAVALLTFLTAETVPARAAPPAPTPETFTAAAARLLGAALAAQKAPGLTVTVRGPLTLAVLQDGKNRFEISLDRPWGECRREPVRCEAAAAEYAQRTAALLIDALAPPAAPERSQLRVVVRPKDYLDSIRAKKQDPVVQLVAGDLWSVAMVDGPQMARVLGRKELAGLGLVSSSPTPST
jgi:hypothetical protein